MMTKDNDGIISRIQTLMSKLYRRTYFSSDQNQKILNDLERRINTSLDNVIHSNIEKYGTNMSRLYDRLNLTYTKDKNKQHQTMEQMFDDTTLMDGILDTYLENKYIRDLDIEIDTVCKYMPKLEEALEVKKEAILSADGFNKDYINLKSDSKFNVELDENFSAEVDEIKKNYKLADFIESVVDNTCKYGEDYVYIVPYDKALNKLLTSPNINRSDSTIRIIENTMYENGTVIENNVFNEFYPSNNGNGNSMNIPGFNLEVVFKSSGYIERYVKESKVVLESSSKIIDDKILDTKMYDNLGSTSTDGLINKKKNIKLDVNGCIMRSIPREDIIPIYIQDMCLGYYYIESSEPDSLSYLETIHSPINSISKTAALSKHRIESEQKNQMLYKIASNISSKLDAKFINANQDLTREIYLILKHKNLMDERHKNTISITFVPPSDIVHFYFKKDKVSHRGISDLDKSLLPAKLYSCLYISNTVGLLTRAHDKRAYFVKQYIDTNISEVLLNTINQIKKGNFGMREITGINNIFGMLGRFNDHVIPVSQNNERPIDFEIIPGQNIDPKQDFMEELKSLSINATGVPMEIIETRGRNIEFARQITMANVAFARHIVKRQNSLQPMLSQMITLIYNYHFMKNEELSMILPPPSYLTINNTLEMLNLANQTKDGIVAATVPQDELNEPWVQIYSNNILKYNLASYVNWSDMERIKEISRVQAKAVEVKNKLEEEEH